MAPPVAGALPIQRGLGSSKVDDDAVLQADYAKYVQAATAKLKSKLNGGSVAFGASPEGAYDAENWEVVDDAKYKKALRCKVKPSKALKDLYDKPEKWSFDCAEWVQVVNLYATMKVYGKEAVDDLAPEKFLLRQHDSPGLETSAYLFERKESGKKFDLVLPKMENKFIEEFIAEDVLLDAIPVGSRVCFKNDEMAKDTAFRNENTLKDGPGTFAAHPMGAGLKKQDVIDRLAKYNQQEFDKEGRDGIYISQVEIYASIPLGQKTREALGLSTKKKKEADDKKDDDKKD